MSMTRQEHLLLCLAEECDEVGQRVMKGLRFGLAEVQPGQPLNNADRIVVELQDLIAVAVILGREGALTNPTLVMPATIEAKLAKIERYMAISQHQGVLEGPKTGVPAGYGKLPKGVRCRCMKLWTDGVDHYCCKGGSTLG